MLMLMIKTRRDLLLRLPSVSLFYIESKNTTLHRTIFEVRVTVYFHNRFAISMFEDDHTFVQSKII